MKIDRSEEGNEKGNASGKYRGRNDIYLSLKEWKHKNESERERGRDREKI